MKNSNVSLPIAIIACSLIVGLTTGLSAKQTGYYLHGGVTYWDGFDAPSFEDDFGLPGLSVDYELEGARAQVSLGVGFHLDDQWSFEAFYVSTPERVVSGNNWVLPPLPSGDLITVSWSATTSEKVGGFSAIYDLYLNENLSVFGEGGIAFVQHDSSETVTVENQPNINLINFVPSSATSAEEITQEIFGAVGVRIPIMRGDAALTFAYQFIDTDEELETSFELGFQWNL